MVVSGTLSNTGTGAVTVTNVNLGLPLAQGDTFTLFNKPLVNGGALAVSGALAIWTNKLAVDGTIAVLSVISTNPTNLTFGATATNVTLFWPADHLGWQLQAQTNNLGTNWGTLPGSTTSNQFVIPLGPTNADVFFRLRLQAP